MSDPFAQFDQSLLGDGDRDVTVAIPIEVTFPRREVLQIAAMHVLWVLDGDRELGQEPGGFTRDLILLACHADEGNMAKLGIMFPAVIANVDFYKNDANGLERLRSAAREYRATVAERDGEPKGN